MLRDREPAPDRVFDRDVMTRVATERADERHFERGGRCRTGREAREPATETVLHSAHPAKGQARSMTLELRIPAAFEQELVKLRPRSDADFTHRAQRSNKCVTSRARAIGRGRTARGKARTRASCSQRTARECRPVNPGRE